MSKIENVNILDIRNVKEDLAKEICQICNIGFLIESDDSQLLLKDCKKINVGANLKAPKDMEVVNYSGELEISKEYLDGFSSAVILLINGCARFKGDIDIASIKEKIYFMIVQGELICPKRLAGAIQSKCKVQGEIFNYNTGYIFFKDKFKLTNKFLSSLPSNSKLSFNKLIILDPIDKNLFREKVSSIEILNRLVINNEEENTISEYVEDYYLVDKTILPKDAKYIDHDILIDDSLIKRFKDSILFVEGKIEIDLDDTINVEDYIKSLYAEKVICKNKAYDSVQKILVNNDINIEIVNGKFIENTGKLTFSESLYQMEGKITIRNMGKLIFEEDIDASEFEEKVLSIINYGLIIAPKKLIGIINSKLKENYGKVNSLEEANKNSKEHEKILYANLSELKL